MLHIPHCRVKSFDFFGLNIDDYAQAQVKSASIAKIEVLPGIRHQTARSTRSDKFYFCLEGSICFQVDDEWITLRIFDLLIILKNEWFSYANNTNEKAQMLLFHVPPFDLEYEEFRTL